MSKSKWYWPCSNKEARDELSKVKWIFADEEIKFCVEEKDTDDEQ